MTRWAMAFMLAALLAGCGEEQAAWSPPPQRWQEMVFRIETRPVQIREGMNEFLVIANRPQHGFVNDLLVHIRTTSSDWKQAIPDGALGVFRRALMVKDIHKDQLFVRLERGGKKGELVFDLAPRGAR